MMNLQLDMKAILFLIIFVMVIPTGIVLLCEIFVSKTGLGKVTYLVAGITAVAVILVVITVNLTKIYVRGDQLHLHNIIYERNIALDIIKEVTFHNSMPEFIGVFNKKNAISFSDVHIGSFKYSRGDLFMMTSGGPFVAIKTNEQYFIFTSSESFYHEIKNSLR